MHSDKYNINAFSSESRRNVSYMSTDVRGRFDYSITHQYIAR